MIQVQCDKCDKVIQVDDPKLGQKVTCPGVRECECDSETSMGTSAANAAMLPRPGGGGGGTPGSGA